MKVFKNFTLRITIQANLQIVNFLDAQLNLDTSTYQPYKKPDKNSVYLKKITITPQQHWKINRKTHTRYISSNENVFAKQYVYIYIYEDALPKSGFTD